MSRIVKRALRQVAAVGDWGGGQEQRREEYGEVEAQSQKIALRAQ